jgi:SUMO ligase MMS21 Smc5/6 complex component
MGSQPRHSIRARPSRLGKRPRRPTPRPQPQSFHSDLLDIRHRLSIAMACAYVASTALKCQEADADKDAAVTIQRCVADELHRQIDRIERVLSFSQGDRTMRVPQVERQS